MFHFFRVERERSKAHFFIHCSQCNKLCPGKLRVRCSKCKGGAFTVHQDPECWDDVLKARRIRGCCESHETACVDTDQGDLPFAEFYFKCAVHSSGGELDFAAPLNLIKTNIRNVPCLACTDVLETVLVFPCASGHVTCLDCFRQYCSSRLMDRQFMFHPDIGWTLNCPAGCDDSFIEEIHHFKLLAQELYDRYQRFATEEFVLQSGGVLCPQPGCGMGLLVDEGCLRVVCQQGCGVSQFFLFVRNWTVDSKPLCVAISVRFLQKLPSRISSRRMLTGRFGCGQCWQLPVRRWSRGNKSSRGGTFSQII